MRYALLLIGIILGAAGGVITYRAAFIASPAAVVVTQTGSVHEVQNIWRIVAGLVLLVAGALLAFFAARRRT